MSYVIETFVYSFPLILRVLCSDSSQLCVHLFIFLLGRPSFRLLFGCQCHSFLVLRMSCMCVSFLFLQHFVTFRAFHPCLLSFLVLSDNQNQISCFRNFISDVRDICVCVSCDLSPPDPTSQVLHPKAHYKKLLLWNWFRVLISSFIFKCSI